MKSIHQLFAYLSFIVVTIAFILIWATTIDTLFSNVYVVLLLTSLLAGLTVPVVTYLATKFGINNSLLFDLWDKTYYIRPWKLYMKAARQNFPRKVYSAKEMPEEVIEEIKNSTMNSKHNHLNKYYDDTH